MASRHLVLLSFVLLAGVLALHASHYYPFLCDDALISLRYARRWADGQGLTWTDGERVEGYTNLLFVLLLGVAAKLGAGLIASARILGFAGVLLAVFCAGLEPRGRGVSFPRLLVGGTLIVATAPFAIWSIGGLEQGLLAGLLALSLRLIERTASVSERKTVLLSGVPLALIALLRADGALLVVALLVGFVCLPRPSLASARRAALAAVPSVATVAASLAFRLAYYGDFQPNSARVKLALTATRMAEGLAYVGRGYSSSSMLVLLALVATALSFHRGERYRLVLPWAVTLVWTAYVAVIGGDIFPGFRQLVPALVPLCFLVADEVTADWARITGPRVIVLPVLALCVVLHATQGTETADNRRAVEERWEWDGIALGETLRSAFGAKHPLLAVDSAGALPFATGFPSIDMLGLNDRHIARTRPPDFGTGYAGHELGDGAYVLGRAPDLVVFQTAIGVAHPEYRSGLELVKSREFRRSYQWVRLERSESGPVGEIWFRRERGKLGVSRRPDRIDVPGYFFGGQGSSAVSRFDARGELVAMIPWDAPGAVPDLAVPAGRWRIDFVPNDPGLVVDVVCGNASMQRAASAPGRVFEADGSTPVSIVVAPAFGAESVALRRATLTRVSDAAPSLRCVPEGTPLRIAGTWLASEQPRRVPFSHPSNITFSRDGLLIDLGEPKAPHFLELSLSQNTDYTLELRRDGHAVWPATIEKKRRSSGPILGRHRIPLPKLPAGGAFELFIQPTRHGASASIGHVALD